MTLLGSVDIPFTKSTKIAVDATDTAGQAATVAHQASDTAGQAQATAQTASQTATQAAATAADAAQAAQTAIATANGKNKAYYGSATPTNPQPGDIWFVEDSSGNVTAIKHYDGTQWITDVDNTALEQQISSAQAAADNATTVGQAAQQTAADAEAKGDAAAKAAEEAKGAATKAQSDAASAVTSANNAVSTANQATQVARDAISKAQDGFDAAQDALSKAGAAETNSQSALNTANTAAKDAQSALTAASNATDTANTAKQVASDAATQSSNAWTKAQDAMAEAQKKADATSVYTKTDIDNALKGYATTTTVNTLTGRVDSAETAIQQNTKAITLKADQSTVNTLTGRISTAEATLKTQANEIAARITKTDADAKYATQTALTATANSLTSSITAVQTNLDNLQVGGRNLSPIDKWLPWSNMKVTKDGYKLTLESTGEIYAGIYHWEENKYSPNTEYVLTFKLKLLSGSFSCIGGHSGIFLSDNEIYIDDKLVGKNWAHGVPFSPSVGQTYSIRVHLKTSDDYSKESTKGTFIQPNRGNFGSSFSVAMWDIQVEKGNKATDWSPAPEDMATVVQFNTLSQTLDSTVSRIGNAEGNISALQQTANSFATRISNAEGNISTLTQTAKGLQTQVNDKVSSSQFTQLAGVVDSKVTSSQVNSLIADDKQIKDTRKTNEKPSYYLENYKRQTVKEFKILSVVGITTDGTYGVLETNVPWIDTSGGQIKQTLYTDVATYVRFGNNSNDSWGPWKKIADTEYVSSQITQTSNSITQKITDTKNNLQSQISQLSDNINLRVKKGDVINQINVSTEGILIDGKKVHITGQTTIDNAVIKDAMIDSMTADKLTAGTIDANVITVKNINASNIVTGTLDASKVTVANIDASKITTGTLDAARIAAGSIDASKLNVASLSAISANLGDVTAGNISGVNINIGNGNFTVDTAGNLVAKNANITGSINATSGSFSGSVNVISTVTNPWGNYDTVKINPTYRFPIHIDDDESRHTYLSSGIVEIYYPAFSETNAPSAKTTIEPSLITFSENDKTVSQITADAIYSIDYYNGQSTIISNGNAQFGNIAFNGAHSIISNDGGQLYFTNADRSRIDITVSQVHADKWIMPNNMAVGYHTIACLDSGKLWFTDNTSNGKRIDIAIAGLDYTGSLSKSSSEAIKANIEPIDFSALDEIMKTDFYSYNYISDLERGVTKPNFGPVIGDSYRLSDKFLTQDAKSIAIDSMTAINSQAIKELYEAMQGKNQDLLLKIADLEARLAKLEA